MMKPRWLTTPILLFSLCACSSSHDIAHGGSPRMTRAEAEKLLAGFHARRGLAFTGLNEHDLAGAAIGEGALYFEYLPAERALRCEALIYKFHDEPKPGVIEGFVEEEKKTSTGGGHVRYEPESRGLYLARSYDTSPGDDAFAEEMARLMEASTVWGSDVLDRVASKVFEPR